MASRRRDLSHGLQTNNPQFQPQPTTVQDVPLIPGYFNSGDEDNGDHGQQAALPRSSHKRSNLRALQAMQ